MNPQMLIAAVIAVLFVVTTVYLFNTMVGRKNRVHFAFASIDAMLKKRYDLIPNLVAVAEKYMRFERGVIEEVTALRAKAVSAGLSDDERVDVENGLTRTLRTLFAVAENYPDLKASGPFLHLQASLNEVEEQLAASRRAFNAAVTDYNNGCGMFPLNIAARLMGYRQKPWFEIPEEERQPVRVWGEQ